MSDALIDHYGIHIGPLYIHFYALILVMSLFVGTWLTAVRAKQRDYKTEDVWDGLMWIVLPALVGARLYHVLTPTPASGLTTEYYLQNPLQILAVWNGGLGIYGGLVGGAMGMLLYLRHRRFPVLPWFDLVVPGVLLGQALGRWGNYVNQELYGAPTSLPWGIEIAPDKRLPGYEQYTTFHPLFLYESLWNLLALGLVLLVERKFKEHLIAGDLVLLYLMLYATGRFLLDFVRLDSNTLGVITTAQWVSGMLVVIAGLVFVSRHWFHHRHSAHKNRVHSR